MRAALLFTSKVYKMVPMIQDAPTMARKTRRPQHEFFVHSKPYELTPFLIAQVLPGETLKKAFYQAKTISDPISSGLLGWHKEVYLFYVKLTDLEDRDAFRAMVVDPDYNATALSETTANIGTMRNGSVTEPAIDFVQKCLDRVTTTYFRNDIETSTAPLGAGGYPLLKKRKRDLFDSLNATATVEAIDPDIDLDADGTVTASEADKARMMWMQQAMQGLTDKSYADFLTSYGIRVEREQLNEPELLARFNEWTYPTRLVDPADGSPTQAVQWSMANSIDKSIRFKEPGFVFGVHAFRPKLYPSFQTGTVTGFLKSGEDWLPGEALNSAAFGFKDLGPSAGPIYSAIGEYRIDLRDALLFGEHFRNVTTPQNSTGFASLALKDYPNSTSLVNLFTLTNGSAGLMTDGIVTFNIASLLQGDVSPPS